MSTLQAIVYGIVQGITEFLPISSSGHLVLLPWATGWPDPGMSFDVSLHLGTLLALVWFFRTEWIALTRSAFRVIRGHRTTPNERMVLYIVVATIPAGVVGFLAEDLVETYLRSPLVVAATLIILALVLIVAERIGRREKSIESLSWTDVIVVGLAQALSIVPGVSRSGVTITAAMFCGMKRDAAARFSFFLATPTIGGAVGKQTFDLTTGGADGGELAMLGVGILTAAFIGYLAIKFMLQYLATHTTYLFVYYRIMLGIVVLLAFLFGFR